MFDETIFLPQIYGLFLKITLICVSFFVKMCVFCLFNKVYGRFLPIVA